MQEPENNTDRGNHRQKCCSNWKNHRSPCRRDFEVLPYPFRAVTFKCTQTFDVIVPNAPSGLIQNSRHAVDSIHCIKSFLIYQEERCFRFRCGVCGMTPPDGSHDLPEMRERGSHTFFQKTSTTNSCP